MPETYLPFVTGGTANHRPKLGVCMNNPYKFPGPVQDTALASLQPEAFHNWGSWSPLIPDKMYTPVIWSPDYQLAAQQYQNLARRYPGRIWLLLNEPDYPTQANIRPEAAIPFVRNWIRLINPICDVALPGVSVSYHQAGKALTWLDTYLDAGGPIGNYWHIHIYAPTVTAWHQQIEHWFEWWSRNGHGRATIISEAALFYTASDDEQIELMESIAQINDPRIAAVYWYAAATNAKTPGLLDADGNLTRLGQAWTQIQQTVK